MAQVLVPEEPQESAPEQGNKDVDPVMAKAREWAALVDYQEDESSGYLQSKPHLRGSNVVPETEEEARNLAMWERHMRVTSGAPHSRYLQVRGLSRRLNGYWVPYGTKNGYPVWRGGNYFMFAQFSGTDMDYFYVLTSNLAREIDLDHRKASYCGLPNTDVVDCDGNWIHYRKRLKPRSSFVVIPN